MTNRGNAQEIGSWPCLRCRDSGFSPHDIAMKIPPDLKRHVTFGDNARDMNKITFISNLFAKSEWKNLRRFWKKPRQKKQQVSPGKKERFENHKTVTMTDSEPFCDPQSFSLYLLLVSNH